MAVPTIASGALRKMLAHTGDYGIAPADLLAAIEVEPGLADDPDARVPIEKLHAAWNVLHARRPRDDGAVLSAQQYAPGDYGLVGFVVMTSATFGDAFDQFVRYSGLWTDEPVFVRTDATVRLVHRHRFPDSPGKRISTEAAFTELVQGARVVSQTRTVPQAVRFAHPAPRDPSAHDAFFGCEVRFGAGEDALEFRAADLALPLPRADAQLGAFLRDAANRALAKRGVDPASVLDQVRGMIAEELARGVPSIDDVARRMATSARTLRRRLEQHGTSFRELLDTTRAELARTYVADRRMPIAEVAFMLGFSEPTTFHRAFKRWTSTTPSAWRATKG
jgi:AraC-like DNA-binding protein